MDLLGRINLPDNPSSSTSYSSDDFSVTSSDNWYSGNWSSTVDLPLFVVVKAGTSYKIYYEDACSPGTTGDWSTSDMLVGNSQQPQLSHVSFYGCSSVPIPGAVWLFSSGLGLLFIRRRRKSWGTA